MLYIAPKNNKTHASCKQILKTQAIYKKR